MTLQEAKIRSLGSILFFMLLGFSGFSQTTSEVVFSHSDGMYSAPFSLSISATGGEDSLFYTLDGADPTYKSLRYAAPIAITTTTVVRAIKYFAAADSSVSYSATFFFNVKHDFPIISLIIDPDTLWNDTTGIYSMGPNASSEYPYLGANFHNDWERKVSFALFDTSGVMQFKQNCGVKIFGAWSRGNAQKSLALYAREKYGKKTFEYRFFKNLEISKFKSIVLRNSGNDWNETMFRDGFLTTLLRPLEIDHAAFQPAVVYLNGQYWGIQNIREKINEDYLESHHFADSKMYNVLGGSGYEILNGKNDSYLDIVRFIEANSLANETNFQWVKSRVDVDNFIRYCVGEIYIGNGDWPGNNIKFYNTNSPLSKWKWILYDTDFGFGIWGTPYTQNCLSDALEGSKPDYYWPNPKWSTLLFRRLMGNTSCRNSFINQMCDRINTTFKPESVVALIDSFAQMYKNEIVLHDQRWNHGYVNFWGPIEGMKNYANNRGDVVLDQMSQQFNLGSRISITVLCDDSMGDVMINSVAAPKGYFVGSYFASVPIILKAIPKPGYRFVKWSSGEYSASLNYKIGKSERFEAIFELAAPSDLRVAINELNFASSITIDSKDWLEIVNSGRTSVDLSNWTLSQQNGAEVFVFPTKTVLAPGDYLVVAKEIDDFKNVYINVDNVVKGLPFGLSSISDMIMLNNDKNQPVDSVTYNTGLQNSAALAMGTGKTLELTHPIANNWVPDFWHTSIYGGTPGQKNSVYSTTSLVAGENLHCNSDFGCYPNPLVSSSKIEFTLQQCSIFSLELFDLSGNSVAKLVENGFAIGGVKTTIELNSNQFGFASNGVYLLRLQTNSQVATIQLMLKRH